MCRKEAPVHQAMDKQLPPQLPLRQHPANRPGQVIPKQVALRRSNPGVAEVRIVSHGKSNRKLQTQRWAMTIRTGPSSTSVEASGCFGRAATRRSAGSYASSTCGGGTPVEDRWKRH